MISFFAGMVCVMINVPRLFAETAPAFYRDSVKSESAGELTPLCLHFVFKQLPVFFKDIPVHNLCTSQFPAGDVADRKSFTVTGGVE
jgi:hypothetical protein